MRSITDKHSDKLNLLLPFLRSGVEGEERISMARVDLEYLISLIILVVQREEEEEKNTYLP